VDTLNNNNHINNILLNKANNKLVWLLLVVVVHQDKRVKEELVKCFLALVVEHLQVLLLGKLKFCDILIIWLVY
jgi:hypothetical protein